MEEFTFSQHRQCITDKGKNLRQHTLDMYNIILDFLAGWHNSGQLISKKWTFALLRFIYYKRKQHELELSRNMINTPPQIL